jgi:hypothetical protein
MCKCNAEAFLLNHCCHEKAISTTDSEFVFSLSYLACIAHVLYFIVICSLSGCTIFFLIISQMACFLEKYC